MSVGMQTEFIQIRRLTDTLHSPSLKIIHYVKIIIKHCIRAQSLGYN